jgi:Fic family protein
LGPKTTKFLGRPLSASPRLTEIPKIYSKELVKLIFRQPYCKIGFIVDAGIAKRQTASQYLQELQRIGILTGEKLGRETVYKHPALLEVLKA